MDFFVGLGIGLGIGLVCAGAPLGYLVFRYRRQIKYNLARKFTPNKRRG